MYKNIRSDATTSKLHLVDLAGSERLKKTKAEGAVAVEGMYVSKSLMSNKTLTITEFL